MEVRGQKSKVDSPCLLFPATRPGRNCHFEAKPRNLFLDVADNARSLATLGRRMWANSYCDTVLDGGDERGSLNGPSLTRRAAWIAICLKSCRCSKIRCGSLSTKS